MRQADKRVLFITEEGDGIARPLYRAKNPAYGLSQLGWDARCCAVLYEQEDHRWNGWLTTDNGPHPTPKFIVSHIFLTPKSGQKPGEPIELEWQAQKPIVEAARNNGQIFIFDLDDDVWNVAPWLPAYKSGSGISAHLAEWTEDINSSNGLICSTPSIAEHAADNGIKVPIWVCSNSVDVRNIDFERGDHEPLRVGWIGLLSYRQHDFEPCIPDLYRALHDCGDLVEFWHMGADFEKKGKAIRSLLPKFPVPIVERPWAAPDLFRAALEELDVAILPAVDHPFNHGRSNVVGLECMAAGAVFLSSPIRSYLEIDRNEFACCYDNLDEDLGYIIDHPEFRQKQRKQQWDCVLNNHSPKHEAFGYAAIFQEAINNG